MIVDCITCPVRGQRCDDCAVTVLSASASRSGSGSAELQLDAAENRAVSMFVGAGLVSSRFVSTLRARRESLQQWETVREVS